MDGDGGRPKRRMTESEIRALARNARTVSSIERIARGLERSPGALGRKRVDAVLGHLRDATREMRAEMADRIDSEDGGRAET